MHPHVIRAIKGDYFVRQLLYASQGSKRWFLQPLAVGRSWGAAGFLLFLAPSRGLPQHRRWCGSS